MGQACLPACSMTTELPWPNTQKMLFSLANTWQPHGESNPDLQDENLLS